MGLQLTEAFPSQAKILSLEFCSVLVPRLSVSVSNLGIMLDSPQATQPDTIYFGNPYSITVFKNGFPPQDGVLSQPFKIWGIKKKILSTAVLSYKRSHSLPKPEWAQAVRTLSLSCWGRTRLPFALLFLLHSLIWIVSTDVPSRSCCILFFVAYSFINSICWIFIVTSFFKSSNFIHFYFSKIYWLYDHQLFSIMFCSLFLWLSFLYHQSPSTLM